jgi:signal transduction histidine kinase
MTGPAWLATRARRRTIRLRLTVTYSVLFLLASAMLLAFTYVFVVRGLGSGQGQPGGNQRLTAADAAFQNQCKQVLTAYKDGRVAKGTDAGLISKCEVAFKRGVAAGAASQRDQAVHALLLYSLVGLGLMGIVSGAVGWLLAGRALRPVHAITAAARRASEENLGERLALGGPDDELKELADTYDAMLARLDAAFTTQRRFVANASHELRTR